MIAKINTFKQPTFQMKIIHVEEVSDKTNPKISKFVVTKTEEGAKFLDLPNALDKLSDLYKRRFKARKHGQSGKGLGSKWIGKKW